MCYYLVAITLLLLHTLTLESLHALSKLELVPRKYEDI